MEQQTDSEAVREFTAGAGQPTPNTTVPMTEAEVDFIGKMILDVGLGGRRSQRENQR